MSYFLNVLISVDQVANALLRGAPDETLSSRAHRMRVKKQRYWSWTANAIDLLFFWQQGHCEQAYRWELVRRKQFSGFGGA